jgi:hypothetical protein
VRNRFSQSQSREYNLISSQNDMKNIRLLLSAQCSVLSAHTIPLYQPSSSVAGTMVLCEH